MDPAIPAGPALSGMGDHRPEVLPMKTREKAPAMEKATAVMPVVVAAVMIESLP
jgi:hypothetical protein